MDKTEQKIPDTSASFEARPGGDPGVPIPFDQRVAPTNSPSASDIDHSKAIMEQPDSLAAAIHSALSAVLKRDHHDWTAESGPFRPHSRVEMSKAQYPWAQVDLWRMGLSQPTPSKKRKLEELFMEDLDEPMPNPKRLKVAREDPAIVMGIEPTLRKSAPINRGYVEIDNGDTVFEVSILKLIEGSLGEDQRAKSESYQLGGGEGCSSSSIEVTFHSGLSDRRDCESLEDRGATTGKSPLRLLDPSDSGTLEAVIAGELHMGGRPDPLAIQEDESDLLSVEETSENEAESADIDYYSLGGTHEEHLDELASAYSDAQSTLDDDNDDEQVATEEEGNEQWPTIRDEEASEEELECDEDEIYDLSSRDQFEENEESQDSSPSSGEESDPDSDDDYTSHSSSVEEVEADESFELEQESRRQVSVSPLPLADAEDTSEEEEEAFEDGETTTDTEEEDAFDGPGILALIKAGKLREAEAALPPSQQPLTIRGSANISAYLSQNLVDGTPRGGQMPRVMYVCQAKVEREKDDWICIPRCKKAFFVYANKSGVTVRRHIHNAHFDVPRSRT